MYEVILFDIDGVLLSEERYFDASALTVYELLCGPQYLGLEVTGAPVGKELLASSGTLQLSDESIAKIRQFVFANDEVLDFMKSRGVNANWDMVYLQFGLQLAHILAQAGLSLQDLIDDRTTVTRQNLVDIGEKLRTQGFGIAEWQDFSLQFDSCNDKHDLFTTLEQKFMELAKVRAEDVTMVADSLWDLGQQAFQDWYLGEPYRETQTAKGKPGFLDNEVPLADRDELVQVLARLQESGASLGIATGRPQTETYVPLRLLGWLQSFEQNRISTASDVLRAQEAIHGAPPLSKPHPFSYLRSYLRSPAHEEVLSHQLPLCEEAARKVLIVGDSIADWMAAKSIGCDFAAVLTGLSGVAAREQFEELGCTFIWNGVLDVKSLLS